MKLFESLWQKRSRPRETGWHRSCSNLFWTTAQTHELEKGFPYNSVPFGMFTVIFTFPHWSKFTSWREKRLANIQLATLCLLCFFRMTTTKPSETTCPLRDLVQGCLILTFIGTLYQQSRVLLNCTEFILYDSGLRPLSKLRTKRAITLPDCTIWEQDLTLRFSKTDLFVHY